MTRMLPFLKTAIPTLLLAVVASSTTGLKADTSVKTAPTLASANLLLIARAASGTKPVVETVPKSQLAWEFDHGPNGTVAIKGPNGTIWQGNLRVSGGPKTPQTTVPNYRLFVPPNGNGLSRNFQFVPPSLKAYQNAPNFAPILPPGKLQPKFILPKSKP